jgi:biotin carboxylase
VTKRLLILTAGVWQLPVIRQAKAMGLEVVVTDKDPGAPGFAAADAHQVVDTRDREAVLVVARDHHVDGVIAEQTDVAVAVAAYVAEQLGLPGIGYDTAIAATNKFLMRERCRLAGIPVPKYRRARSAREAIDAASEIGFPVVLKPLDAQASRGVGKLTSANDVDRWFETASELSSDGSMLVEEMMVGTESSIESFVSDDHVTVFGVCEKVKCSPPYSFDLRLIYPASFPAATMESMIRLNERVVHAIGIPMGITHAEYIVTSDGPRLIEIAARGCGAGVATQLLPAMTGVNLIEQRIRQALGQSVDLTPTRSLAGLLEFLMLPPGKLRSLDGLEEARRVAGVIDVNYFAKPGDTIALATDGSQRPGYLLAVGRRNTDLLRISDEVQRCIRYEIQ